jgi:disulfide bond formation protein DsbB
MMSEEQKTIFYLLTVGALVGLGQILASKEILTKRIVIGRMLSSAGLGASAATVLAFMPQLPIIAQFGLAAALASLGTSGLERLFQKWLDK